MTTKEKQEEFLNNCQVPVLDSHIISPDNEENTLFKNSLLEIIDMDINTYQTHMRQNNNMYSEIYNTCPHCLYNPNGAKNPKKYLDEHIDRKPNRGMCKCRYIDLENAKQMELGFLPENIRLIFTSNISNINNSQYWILVSKEDYHIMRKSKSIFLNNDNGYPMIKFMIHSKSKEYAMNRYIKATEMNISIEHFNKLYDSNKYHVHHHSSRRFNTRDTLSLISQEENKQSKNKNVNNGCITKPSYNTYRAEIKLNSYLYKKDCSTYDDACYYLQKLQTIQNASNEEVNNLVEKFQISCYMSKQHMKNNPAPKSEGKQYKNPSSNLLQILDITKEQYHQFLNDNQCPHCYINIDTNSEKNVQYHINSCPVRVSDIYNSYLLQHNKLKDNIRYINVSKKISKQKFIIVDTNVYHCIKRKSMNKTSEIENGNARITINNKTTNLALYIIGRQDKKKSYIRFKDNNYMNNCYSNIEIQEEL